MTEYKKIFINRDIPEFVDLIDEDNKVYEEKLKNLDKNDKFGFSIYANKLMRIIQNGGPLSIGLLGGWGTGKSSILNIFKAFCIKENYKVIYFNAWKYADDSFRRQFLLESCDNNEREKLKIRLRSEVDKNLSIWQKIKIMFNFTNVLQFIVSIIIIIGLFLLYKTEFKIPKDILYPMISALLVLFLSRIYYQIEGLKIPTESQIIYPEDFENEFLSIIKKYKNNDKIIFIIDDIDRCPSSMIMDIMDSLKNFLAPSNCNEEIYKKCYFVTAMDNRAVLTSLLKDRSNQYKKEDVLKFFDIPVRLPQIHDDDIFDFMNGILLRSNQNIEEEDKKIPITVIQNAYRLGYNTPRKIKHFLNEFILFKEIIDNRIKNRELQIPLPYEKIYEIASGVLLLRMRHQDLYYEIVNEHKGSFKNYIKTYSEDEIKTEIENQNTVRHNNPNKILDNVKLIKSLNLDKNSNIAQMLIYSKLPNYAMKFNNFNLIQEMLIKDPDFKDDKILSELYESENKDIITLLISNLNRQKDLFLQNLLGWIFIIIQDKDITDNSFKGMIVNKIETLEIIEQIKYDEFSTVMGSLYPTMNIERILTIFVDSYIEYWMNDSSIVKLIEDIYKYSTTITNKDKLVNDINKHFIKSIEREDCTVDYNIFLKLNINDLYKQLNLPSAEVIKATISDISKNDIEINKLVYSVCNKFWYNCIYEPITNKYIEILQSFNDNEIQQWDSFPEIIEWIFSNIIEINKMMPSENAATIFDIISKRYNKQNVIGKITLFEVIIMTKLSVQDENKKQVIQRDLNNISVLFNANELEKIKIYIDDKEEYFPDIMDIWNSIVNGLVDLIFVRMNSYSEKNRDIGLFMLKTHSKLINNQNTNKFMHNLIIQNNSTEINIWSIFIIELFNYDDKLDLWKNIIRYIKNRIINSNQDSILIKTLFELLAQIYEKLQSRDASGLDLNEISREKIISWLLDGFTNTGYQHAIQNNYDDLINTILNIDKNSIERIIDETIRLMKNDGNYPLLLKLIPSVCRVINKRYKRFIVEYILFNMSLLKTNDMNKIKQSYNFLNEFDFDYSIKNKGLLNDLRDTMVEIDKRNQPNMNWKNMINKINKRIKNI